MHLGSIGFGLLTLFAHCHRGWCRLLLLLSILAVPLVPLMLPMFCGVLTRKCRMVVG
jgi:hypothetical protein